MKRDIGFKSSTLFSSGIIGLVCSFLLLLLTILEYVDIGKEGNRSAEAHFILYLGGFIVLFIVTIYCFILNHHLPTRLIQYDDKRKVLMVYPSKKMIEIPIKNISAIHQKNYSNRMRTFKSGDISFDLTNHEIIKVAWVENVDDVRIRIEKIRLEESKQTEESEIQSYEEA